MRAVRVSLVSTVLVAMTAPCALASGFANRDDSAIFAGYAFSGAASSGDSLATIVNNPAAMTLFDDDAIEIGASYQLPHLNARGTQGTTTVPADHGSPAFQFAIPGNDGPQIAEQKLLPSFFALFAPTPELRFGLAVTEPFNLDNSYGSDSPARFQTELAHISTVDINPSFAYKVLPWLSIGAGASIQTFSANLSNAIDFGALVPTGAFQLGGLNRAQLQQLLNLHVGKPGNDGIVDVREDSVSAGFDVGLLAEPIEGTRLGLSYRSGIDQKATGRTNFFAPTFAGLALVPFGQGANVNSTNDVALPGNITFGITQKIDDDLTVNASYQYTFWHTFKSLDFLFANPRQPIVDIAPNFHDTSFLAIGASRKLGDGLTLRAGFDYDQTPTSDAFRLLQVPDSDQFDLSGGLSYAVTDGVALNASYTHGFFSTARVNQSVMLGQQILPLPITDTVTASYQQNKDVFDFSISVSF